MFILVYNYVLTNFMAQPLPSPITNAFTLISERTVDYDQSMAGSFVVELSGWISWLQFFFLHVVYLGWSSFVLSLSGFVAYVSNSYLRDVTSSMSSHMDFCKLMVFRSTYKYHPFVAVDQRCLYFAGLMISRTVSYIFLSNVKW